jgi:Zn-finger nucleic acid-binding protein
MDKIKCPVCNKSLKTITYENREVDVCQACGGIWFDKIMFKEWITEWF